MQEVLVSLTHRPGYLFASVCHSLSFTATTTDAYLRTDGKISLSIDTTKAKKLREKNIGSYGNNDEPLRMIINATVRTANSH